MVIPFYNAEDFLEQCLLSVIRQHPHQIICVNDGSTDDSMVIVDRLKSEYRDTIWVVFEQNNQGLGSARNRGTALATGDYVAWLDADDLYVEKAFSRLKTVLEENPQWVVWSALERNEQGQQRKRFWKTVNSVRDLLLNGNPYLPSACMLRLDVAKDFPFAEDRTFHGAEDLHLWYRLLSEGVSPTHVNGRLTIYRIHSNAMSQQLDDHIKHVFNVLESLSLPPHLLSVTKKRKYYELARVLQRRRAHRLALTYYFKCQWWRPKVLLLLFLNLFRVAV